MTMAAVLVHRQDYGAGELALGLRTHTLLTQSQDVLPHVLCNSHQVCKLGLPVMSHLQAEKLVVTQALHLPRAGSMAEAPGGTPGAAPSSVCAVDMPGGTPGAARSSVCAVDIPGCTAEVLCQTASLLKCSLCKLIRINIFSKSLSLQILETS